MTAEPALIPMTALGARIRRSGDSLLVGTDTENVLELDETAAFIWRQVDGTRSVERIGARVAEEYDIDLETAVRDVTELLGQLAEFGVVSLEPPG